MDILIFSDFSDLIFPEFLSIGIDFMKVLKSLNIISIDLFCFENFPFPALVTPENNHSYQKLFPSLGKWQMNEVKYYLRLWHF